MAPRKFDLALRTRPPAKHNPTSYSDQARVTKLKTGKPNSKNMSKLIEFSESGATKMSLQSNASLQEDIESLTQDLAITRLDSSTVVRYPKPTEYIKRQAQSRSRPSLITSDAAGDALAGLLSEVNIHSGPAIYLKFYSQSQTEPIADRLTIHLDEAPDLLSLVNLMHRRRRHAFRECDFTKQPPIAWGFAVYHRYIDESYNEGHKLDGKLVTRERGHKLCVDNNDAEPADDPHAAYRIFCAALAGTNPFDSLLNYSYEWRREYGVRIEGIRDGQEAIDINYQALLEDGEDMYGTIELYFR